MNLTRRKEEKTPKPANLPKWRSLDPVLLLVSLTLSACGVLAVYVAGTEAQQVYATNQALGFVLGIAGAIPLALIDYRHWQRYLRLIYGLVLLILLLVLVLGATAGGAQRWVDIGPVQVQPSEFAKLGMVIVLAGYFAERAIGEHTIFLKALGILVVPAVLVFMQPDLGTALVFGAVFIAMAYIAGARLIQLAGLVVAGVVGAVLAVKLKVLEEYQVARLTAFLDPACSSDISYQVCQSKMAIGSGGITGKGLDAQTLANLGYLPAYQTDFIFSNLAERVGFVGSIVLIALFFLLVWRILHVATISRDRFGVLIAVGVATIFLFHAFVNVGMTMGIMPVTGIPLPFISYGRSNLVVSVLSLGFLQSIAIHSKAEVSKHPTV
jgi:rod shape determining protein RodA